MYYTLREDLVLRGWVGRAWVLVLRPQNTTRTLNYDEFQTLLLCDGLTNVHESELSHAMKDVLRRLINKGFVTSSVTQSPISEEQHYCYYRNRYVESVFWSITGRCNFRCRHCYMDAPEAAFGELTHESAMEIVDQMAACGVLSIDITGGEPFVRKDFWKLVDRIALHKMRIGQVYTNGWLISEKVLNSFENRGMKPSFSLSFDGIGWHDWMRGICGAEEKALNVLALCKKRGFPINVEMCVHKGNIGVLRETVNLLARLGVPAIKVSNISDTALWRKNSEGLGFNDKEYVDEMISYIPFFFEDGAPLDLMLSGVVNLKKNTKEYDVIPERYDNTKKCLNCYLCGTTRTACYITPEGRLLPCMPMTSCEDQSAFPLIKDIGLRSGLDNSFYMEYVNRRVKDLLSVNKKCNACEHKYKCGGGCRAKALMGKDHDLMGCDYDQCMMFENGYPDKIRAVCDAAIAKYCPDAKKDNE